MATMKRLCPAAVLIALTFLLTPAAYPGTAAEVSVNNFPALQQVRGAVTVEGTTRTYKLEGLLVTPGARNDLNELLHAGKVDTDGFTSVTLSLQGEVKSTTFLSGNVGLMLIPDEEPVLRVLKEVKQIQFPVEIACSVRSGDSEYFSCALPALNVGFPRYRVYFYNTLNKPAEVNAYLYLKK
ncbi:hypothetical protein L4X63_11520 [Geomonas sp. Red32]|uniref:hypothetical protein n=1 Tax=Geomonas sp. Red32 TaxID=2912856 RepID=UPI00202CB62C|nr:hypothetical protein [Geomonas sp. Red32]MCM0082219.1 hypothetical protein [Geomonas sp. Red32]